jgi:HEAT repeats
MSKIKIILWLGLPAYIGALVLSFVLQPREPVYHGYSLTQWLDDYYADSRADINDDSPHTEAYFAIRAIGTNALPTLLDWLAHKPAEPNPRLAAIAQHLPDSIADNRFVWKFTHPEWRPNNWEQAFMVLGDDPDIGVVHELTRLMQAPDAPDDGSSATLALSYMVPAGLPPLAAAALDPHARCRLNAINALGEMWTGTPAVVPVLKQLLDNPDEQVRTAATNALFSNAEKYASMHPASDGSQ